MAKLSKAAYIKAQKQMLKLLVEYLILAVSFAGAMVYIDRQKEEQVLGARIETPVPVVVYETCVEEYEVECLENPATNDCAELYRGCEEL
jgi:hypothetical protein